LAHDATEDELFATTNPRRRHARFMSPSALVASSSSSTEAIRAYLASAISRIDKAIGSAAFVEPRSGDVDRAARIISPLVETLAALAMGTIVGGVAHAVRRALGGEVTAKVAAMLAAQVGRYEPRPIPALAVLDESPSRSFGEELAKRLRMRVAMIAGDTRVMLISIAELVAQSGDVEAHAFERVIATCAADSMIDDKFARDLQRGWAAWTAVVTSGAVEEPSALWKLWAQRVRGEREAVTPSTAEVVAAGFIARIG
jgi:hypothetical protein